MSASTERRGKSAPSAERTLRLLFLTLFLRGRGARGLRKQGAPKSVATKLRLSLLTYTLLGGIAMFWVSQPLFAFAIYQHAMTFVLVGMFVVGSAGEVLFNNDEADILLHRPIEPRALLWAKIGVLGQVSLWLAGAFNLGGLIAGTIVTRSFAFPLLHAVAMVLQTLFCTSCVVLTYQLCLRWFGRERLEQLMTATQVLVAVGFVVAAQVLPRVLPLLSGLLDNELDSLWIVLLPPVWFAGLSSLAAADASAASWLLAAVAVLATACVVYLAVGRLAHDYLHGLQNLGDRAPARPRRRARRPWAAVLAGAAPLRWWLRDPAERAAFLLTAAYLFRDRDTKLRFYPGVAPFAVLPFVFLFQPGRGGFSVALGGVFIGMMPMLALQMLHVSQQWQASDLFRVAPMRGPGPLAAGARRAVLVLFMAPLLAVFTPIVWLVSGDLGSLALLLPGVIAMPAFTLIPCLNGDAVPLSLPVDESKAAGRGLKLIGVMVMSAVLAGVSSAAYRGGWLPQLLAVEALVVAIVYFALRPATRRIPWPPIG